MEIQGDHRARIIEHLAGRLPGRGRPVAANCAAFGARSLDRWPPGNALGRDREHVSVADVARPPRRCRRQRAERRARERTVHLGGPPRSERWTDGGDTRMAATSTPSPRPSGRYGHCRRVLRSGRTPPTAIATAAAADPVPEPCQPGPLSANRVCSAEAFRGLPMVRVGSGGVARGLVLTTSDHGQPAKRSKAETDSSGGEDFREDVGRASVELPFLPPAPAPRHPLEARRARRRARSGRSRSGGPDRRARGCARARRPAPDPRDRGARRMLIPAAAGDDGPPRSPVAVAASTASLPVGAAAVAAAAVQHPDEMMPMRVAGDASSQPARSWAPLSSRSRPPPC